jgi:uncharacterized membrane protein SpoIIM required for sporulation
MLRWSFTSSVINSKWIQKRKPYWERLAGLLDLCDRRGLSALSCQDLREVSLLYRQVASDYASVHEDPTALRMDQYLNQLLTRSHNALYMGSRREPERILSFYGAAFPRIFRETFNYTLAAFIVFLAAAVAGLLVTLSDPAFQRFFLGGPMSDTIERHKMWTHSILAIKPLASSAIMTNNLTVSFTAFALGITAGIGTIWMLAVNGMLMGVISGACWQSGMLTQLLSFVAPHGVLELPSVFMAGGAGLLVARGLLFPGLLPRRDALTLYGGQGVRLALGIIPLLVIAGVIEAFVSPSSVPITAKFALAFALGSSLAVYLTTGGRKL